MTGTEDDRLTYADVRRRFDLLEPPVEGSRLAYAVESLGSNAIKLGKGRSSSPCLVIATPDGASQQDKHFANLRLRHGLRLRLWASSDLSTYSVLECVSDDEAIRDWFLRLVPTMHAKIEAASDLDSVQEVVSSIAELFRVIDRDARKTLSGLWGELALIVASDDPVSAVRAWHAANYSTHDFTLDGFHLEVKATEAARVHHFSPAQLMPSESVMVASLTLEQSDEGTSVLDLYEESLELLSVEPALQDKVHRLVIACIGRRIGQAEDARFDLPSALSSAKYVMSELIPQIRGPFPAGVANVRFTADVSTCESADMRSLQCSDLWGNLAAAYVRRNRS